MTACATSSSGVFETGKDTYTVVAKAYGRVNKATLMKNAYAEANSFCKTNGKELQPVGTEYQNDPWSGLSSYELTFQALEKNDPNLKRPIMGSVPDTKIEVISK
jgi:hypothetical protein